ncbi:MAG: hypothetical protein PHU34_01580 [Candidatus Methanoperedens sp.]|nr:hypothetical protein [Candidatus Methanoperedens sp.]
MEALTGSPTPRAQRTQSVEVYYNNYSSAVRLRKPHAAESCATRPVGARVRGTGKVVDVGEWG